MLSRSSDAAPARRKRKRLSAGCGQRNATLLDFLYCTGHHREKAWTFAEPPANFFSKQINTKGFHIKDIRGLLSSENVIAMPRKAKKQTRLAFATSASSGPSTDNAKDRYARLSYQHPTLGTVRLDMPRSKRRSPSPARESSLSSRSPQRNPPPGKDKQKKKHKEKEKNRKGSRLTGLSEDEEVKVGVQSSGARDQPKEGTSVYLSLAFPLSTSGKSLIYIEMKPRGQATGRLFGRRDCRYWLFKACAVYGQC